MDILTSEHSKKVLEQLPEPKDVWKYFLWCTETPRGSYNIKVFVEKIMKLAKDLGLESKIDKVGNVVILKPSSPGYEKSPSVCIQCHSDMVCVYDDTKIQYNKLVDAIKPRIEGDWVYATHTSLGADNGIGIAAAFAVLANKDLKHPSLEVLITADEEVGMDGAFGLESGFLNAKKLINVDSEEEYAICIGCAGGFNCDYSLPLKREKCSCKSCEKLKVTVFGLLGGHSGCDIHLQRASAMQWLTRLFLKCTKDFNLYNLESGEAHNAIPRSATAVIGIPKDSIEEFKKEINAEHKILMEEYKSIENVEDIGIKFEEGNSTFELPLSKEDTKKVLSFLYLQPNGVERMSPDMEKLVETSAIAAITSLKESSLEILVSARSSRQSQMEHYKEYLNALAVISGAKAVIGAEYPGWLPNPKSAIVQAMVKAYDEVIGSPKPNLYAIHAGLECGLFQKNYPGLDCVSIGPEINSPHSAKERVRISSVDRFYKLLVKALENSK